MKTKLQYVPTKVSINILLIVLCLVFHSLGLNATIRYVKPVASGSADGSSWANASDDIQTMINASAIGDSVWVAAGEYKPNAYPPACLECVNPRYYTFYIQTGVQLFGNFTGTETDISQRDFGSNTTFLSGDLNGDDVVIGSFNELDITHNNENVYHVILNCDISFGFEPVTIDGFTIKGGNATDTLGYLVNSVGITRHNGGGILNQKVITTISNCFIAHNSAKFGGGIYNIHRDIFIKNSIISNNVASFTGGGIAIFGTQCTLINNSFIGNIGIKGGGAIHCEYSVSDITNNEIIGNTTDDNGGGMYFIEGTTKIDSNTITNNYAKKFGGGFFSSNSEIEITNNIISYNIADISGGGLAKINGTSSIINNVVSNNNAEMYAGGLYISSSSNTITNNTIVSNNVYNEAGGIYVSNGAIIFTNNILWNNKRITELGLTDADLFLTTISNTFRNNILQLDSTLYTPPNKYLGVSAQGNLFAQNPEFVNISNPKGEDLIYFTEDDGLRLQMNSPALNAGTYEDAPETDILGTPRDIIPDIGAYEHGVFLGIQPNTNSKPAIVLNAYPNPATDAITFTFTTPITEISSLILYAIDGRNRTSLYKGTPQANETNSLTIDTKDFAAGTYIAVLRCGANLAEHRTIMIVR